MPLDHAPLALSPAALRAHWPLDPEAAYLNHGSFGATPRAVLAHQRALQDTLERQPVDFFVRALPRLLDDARAAVARFLGADPLGLAFVPNATYAVNTVLAHLPLAPGDELLVTDHGYAACTFAARHVAARAGARVVTAHLPYPGATPDGALAAILAAVTPRTRLALLDHVTSPTGLVLPIERLVPALAALGVDTLVDGAHAPGMLPLDLDALGAAYVTGNFHKWPCAPKGAAFLHVRHDRRAGLHPLAISHGWGAQVSPDERFRLEFDWTGTTDPTAALTVPFALDFVASLHPDGWPGVRAHNRATALAARAPLMDALGLATAPCDDAMIGSLVALPLPDGDAEALNRALWERYRVEVVVAPWPAPPRRLLRISAQLYNGPEDYTRLIAALRALGLTARR